MLWRRRYDHTKDARFNEALRKEGIIPIQEVGPDDVFITGYPKSGNTWFQIMVAMLVYGLDTRLTPFTTIAELIPDLSDRRYYRRHAKRMFFKSHALPSRIHKRVVYLLRDGRDVMVSYRHYRENVDKTTYDFREFCTAKNKLWPCHWPEHVNQWTKNRYGVEMITIRYEDLVSDPVPQLRRFCEFAGLDRTQAQLEAAVAETTFDTLRKKEAVEGAIPVPAFTGEQKFFRRGKIGSHADEMPPEVLERFMKQAEPTLRRLGYLG